VDNATDSSADGVVRGDDAGPRDSGDTETLARCGGFISAATAMVFNQSPGRVSVQHRAINPGGMTG